MSIAKNSESQGYGLHVLAATIIVVLISLGVWQLHRMQWKTQLIAHIDAEVAKPLSEFPRADFVPTDLEYRKLMVAGAFLGGSQARLFAMNSQGVPGYHLYAGFALEDGRELIVNRGWLPKELSDRDPSGFQPPKGEIRITGRVRLARKGGLFSPDNDPHNNVWYVADIEPLAAYLSLAEPEPIILEIDDDRTESWPQGGVTRLSLPNNHFQYAVTWFALAAIAMLIFGLFLFRRREGNG